MTGPDGFPPSADTYFNRLNEDTLRKRAEKAEAEVERLRQVLTTLATDTNISQEERKYHARSALEAKP